MILLIKYSLKKMRMFALLVAAYILKLHNYKPWHMKLKAFYISIILII
jgi:hypothetical protein